MALDKANIQILQPKWGKWHIIPEQSDENKNGWKLKDSMA